MKEIAAVGDTCECGCSVFLAPCEHHKLAMETGDETARVTVQFDTKYSRFAGNRHRVDLERVQRIQLGLDNEPMTFDESTLADMLQHMADERPYETEAFVLRALANALLGKDSHHRLVVKQKKPGKWQSPFEFEQKRNQEIGWLWTLGAWEREGMKTEAAIARIAELSDVSRASVFAGIKSAEEFIERAWSLGNKDQYGPRPRHLTNPRPAKSQNS